MEKKNFAELTGNDRYEGFCVDLAGRIADKLGFSYEIRVVRDGLFGEGKTSDGEWTGMVGELTRRVSCSCLLLMDAIK